MSMNTRVFPLRPNARQPSPTTLLSRDDISRESGLSIREVDRLIRRGLEGDPNGLASLRVGRRRLVCADEFVRFVDLRLAQAEAPSEPTS
jgi:hypothetical protein